MHYAVKFKLRWPRAQTTPSFITRVILLNLRARCNVLVALVKRESALSIGRFVTEKVSRRKSACYPSLRSGDRSLTRLCASSQVCT